MANYYALTDFLRRRSEPEVELTFTDLDSIVGGLPKSAHQYAAWWANSRTAQPHAHYWLDAGRQAKPDFNGGRVRFLIGSEIRRGPHDPGTRRDSPVYRTTIVAPPGTLRATGEPFAAALAFSWLAGGQVAALHGSPIFPAVPTQPGIYRFTLSSIDGQPRVYVGESDNLTRRMMNYRNPGPTQPTNVRMFTRILETVEGGGTVDLDLVLEAAMDDDPLDLNEQAARRLLENAILTRLKREGIEVENL